MRRNTRAAVCAAMLLTTVGSVWAETTNASEETTAEQAEAGNVIVDHAGNTVEIPEEIDSIVVTDVLPLASVLPIFLGTAETITGIHPSSMAAAKSGILGEMYPELLEADTSFYEGGVLNLEQLMTLEPDIVFYNAGNTELGQQLIDAGLTAVGVSVTKWEYNAIETYNNWVSLLGQIFPEYGETAEAIADYSEEVYQEIQERVSELTDEEKKDVLFLYSYDDTGMITSSQKFFGQFWCDAINANNVAKDVQAERSNAAITMEQVYEWNPEVIFITNFTDRMPEDLYTNAILEDDWSTVSAVTTEDVYKMPLGTYRTYTPNADTPLTLMWLAQSVYPELFADLDIRQEAADYYEEFYGVELTEKQLDVMYHEETAEASEENASEETAETEETTAE